MGNIERTPTSVTACPTCGQAVTVVSSGEGTSHYSGLDVREVFALREELRGAGEALRAYRSALRSGEAESDQLRVMADAVLAPLRGQ